MIAVDCSRLILPAAVLQVADIQACCGNSWLACSNQRLPPTPATPEKPVAFLVLFSMPQPPINVCPFASVIYYQVCLVMHMPYAKVGT